jgi:cobalt-zinc-cadmium efflux system membrane fusion protein
MKMLRILLSTVLLAAACDRTTDVEPDEHADPAAHQHEDQHDEIPRVVALSDQVIKDAGIVTAPAKLEAIAPTIRLPGEVVAHPDHTATVAARIQGIIETVRVQPGDTIERGKVLATVRAPNLQSLRAAEAALRAKAASARANAERLDALVETRMASRQEAIAANAEAEALQAEATAARERLRALGVRGSGRAITFSVRSPIDGIVLQRDVTAGAPVTPETVVATIVSADVVWFQAHVFERDVARVQVGSPAVVHLNAYPDAGFEGHVDYVSHQVDPGARTLSARIPLSNPDGRLRLGLYGTARVTALGETTEPVLAVPNSAITRMLDRTVVFVRHDDGHFEVHDVVPGRSDTNNTEIVHGLNENERVVTEGVFSVKSALLRDRFAEGGH